MRRILTVFIIILLTLVISKFFSTKLHLLFDLSKNFKEFGETTFVFVGIFVGGVYWLKFGGVYSYLDGLENYNLNKHPTKSAIPGQKYINKAFRLIWRLIRNTKIGNYFRDIYAKPVQSEQMLGGFFFGKTIITTAIAFYYLDTFTLLLVLGFSAFFDSFTGVYQHTLMNFFHKTNLKNRVLVFLQNLGKRYLVDVFRAEIITIFLMGLSTFTGPEQFHILQNRFVSASYYFNAIIIDKLVDLGAISRNFRSNFVIFASTAGGLLCLLDFAKTDFPAWVPAELIASIPVWMPGPLKLLAIFNLSVFGIAVSMYAYKIIMKKWLEKYPIKKLSQANIVNIIQSLFS